MKLRRSECFIVDCSSAQDDYFVVVGPLVRTMDDEIPVAAAFAVRDGRFVDIGTIAGVLERNPGAAVRPPFDPVSWKWIERYWVVDSGCKQNGGAARIH